MPHLGADPFFRLVRLEILFIEIKKPKGKGFPAVISFDFPYTPDHDCVDVHNREQE
jgi:hypothetical protein